MECIFRIRFSWTFLLIMICLVHFSYQTSSGGLEGRILKLETMLQTSSSAVEVRIQTLENLIMNKLSDMGADSVKAIEDRFKKMETIVMNKLSDIDYKFSSVDVKLREFDPSVVNVIKERVENIDTKVESGGQSFSQSPSLCDSTSEGYSIDEVKEQDDAIGEDIRLSKKDLTIFDGKLENLLNSIKSAETIQNLKMENLDRQIKEGLELLKHVQESVTQEEVNTANHEGNTNLSIGLEIIEKQINQSSESLILIIEEIKLVKTDGVLSDSRLNTLSLDINNLTINTNKMYFKAENIEKQINQSSESLSFIIDKIEDANKYGNSSNFIINALSSDIDNHFSDMRNTLDSYFMNISEMVQSNKNLHCIDGFYRLSHRLGSESFCVEEERKTWKEARSYCQGIGGDLVQPSNLTALGAYMKYKGFTDNFWLGGSDTDREGDWKWINKTPISPDHWYPGQPNGGGNQDCLALSTWNLPNGLYDYACTTTRSFICEQRKF